MRRREREIDRVPRRNRARVTRTASVSATPSIGFLDRRFGGCTDSCVVVESGLDVRAERIDLDFPFQLLHSLDRSGRSVAAADSPSRVFSAGALGHRQYKYHTGDPPAVIVPLTKRTPDNCGRRTSPLP